MFAMRLSGTKTLSAIVGLFVTHLAIAQIPMTPSNFIVRGETVLFQQPQEGGIANNLFVPLAVHQPPPNGVMVMILWQPNPNTSNGLLVPTSWNAASKTGFNPSTPLSAKQMGFQDQVGSSTAQMDGGTVGAYLNSADLPSSTADQKMMITPQIEFFPGQAPSPFPNSGAVLNAEMDLQVPTASGPMTYVLADFLFQDPNGVLLSYGVKIFANGLTNQVVGSGYDSPSGAYMLNSPLGVDQRFVAAAPGSGVATGSTWLGWRHFGWSVSQAQFAAALAYLAAQYPAFTVLDPSKWVLIQTHLNAEFHYQPAAAELGWSMQNWKVWQ
jgi:hypothetical protein